jgi:hypothetical protein
MSAYAGKSGAFLHGAVSYPAKNWSADLEDAVIDTTTTISGGWREHISGLRVMRFTAECVFDPALAQLGPGSTLTNIILRVGASYALTMASGIVSRVRPSTSVDGAAMETIEGISIGTVNTTFA